MSSMSMPVLGQRTYKAFCLPVGFSGCALWRYRMPLGKLKQLGGPLSVVLADNPDKVIRMSQVEENVSSADLISIQAPGYKDAYLLMKVYRGEGKKVVVDYDDYSFDLSPGNPRYVDLGIKECEVFGPDGTKVYEWKDGLNGFDLQANVGKYKAFQSCLRIADMVTTTTEYLADKFRPYNKNVVVLPNSVDLDIWKPIPRPSMLNGQVRIGWFGGDSHFEDLRPLKTLLPRVCKAYPNAKIVLQAPLLGEWRQFFKDIPPDQLEWHPWADLRYYTLFLAAKHWDIGLCPLEDSEFNKCKSNIKCLEFASVKAAVVAQNMTPYSNHIRHGETGLLARTEDEWFEAIAHLIEDSAYRKRLQDNALQDVHDNYDLAKNCRLWEKAYVGCIEGSHVG